MKNMINPKSFYFIRLTVQTVTESEYVSFLVFWIVKSIKLSGINKTTSFGHKFEMQ